MKKLFFTLTLNKYFTKIGKIFYCMGIVGLVKLHFFFSGFRPVFMPKSINYQPIIYIFSIAVIILCLFMLLNFKAKASALTLGFVFFIMVLIFQIPFQLENNFNILGSWTNALKLLALSGGALVVAGTYNLEKNSSNKFFYFFEKIIPYGKNFFSIMLIIFGIDHFLYTEGVATLVPNWIPFHLFWTYFAAFALMGTGVCIIFKIKVKLIGLLAGLMLFIWFLILHLPRAFTMPAAADNGNEWSSVFQSLAFSGIAIVLAFESQE